ncbi:uncharacterized protein BDCG_16809 [Blastomyces dermatitidis ER-3]|uniref:Uncharacterized protein n=2 Tax=Ajellomyces dermatitidis TaxID=5039 RepID=A0A0J9ET02_AJEDA|nr:uncharacterized protein BDCG_16809 [Blastomyces dermatitidis ER-3]EQL29915.1 hypothetical protein BDFG_07530 [Blastomyces dermatitidis ATCC 26199]KMW69172.1 hypothetical protein BDDG_13337 [Blastomyces dermatitidis ATCC 18188]OAT00946.1 hypothetical protein BDCG_16809 [Blastomyces dermatitidis ER-3]
MFLPTTTLDPTMQSQVHVGIKYIHDESLSWGSQIPGVKQPILQCWRKNHEIEIQIKNIARAAFALTKGGSVIIMHMETALNCAEQFDQDFHGRVSDR